MKIYSNQADNFISGLKNNTGMAVLIYGPDSGAVRNYKNKLVGKLRPNGDQFGIVEFTADQIKHDPALLSNEIDSPSFFSDKKIIIIDGMNATVAEEILSALQKVSADLSLIVTADELGRESKLKSLFENHKTFPAIICYKEDMRAVKSFISNKFKDANVKLEPATLDFLCSSLGEDKQVTVNEIDKILIYLGEQKFLSFEEASSLLADNSELALNDISYGISLRNSLAVDKMLIKAFAESINMIAVVRSCIAHFQKIAIVQNNMHQGQSLDEALKSLRPPIFFKQVDQFRNSISKWNKNQIKDILAKLLKLELDLKNGNLDAELIGHYELLKLAV